MRLSKLLRLLGVGVISLAFLTAPALAADDDDENKRFCEPGIAYRKMKTKKPYIDWLAGTLLVLACVLPAFKNPHRSHLD